MREAAASGATAAKLAGVDPLPEAGASEPAKATQRIFGREIDPVRVVVWSLFGVLVLAAWAAIVWLILRASG